MEIYEKAPQPRFAASTTPVNIEIASEPYIVATRLGYAPMVAIRNLGTNEQQSLLIGARTLTTALEELRKKNGGKLVGVRLAVSRESDERIAKYIVKPLS